MAKIAVGAVALGVAGAIMLWSKSPAVDGSSSVEMISPQELHALAHIEGLPIQHFEDSSLIFPALAKK